MFLEASIGKITQHPDQSIAHPEALR